MQNSSNSFCLQVFPRIDLKTSSFDIVGWRYEVFLQKAAIFWIQRKSMCWLWGRKTHRGKNGVKGFLILVGTTGQGGSPGLMDVEGCSLFVAHKLKRMRTNPPSRIGALPCHLALRSLHRGPTPLLLLMVLCRTTSPLTCPKLSLPHVTDNNKHITQKFPLSLSEPESQDHSCQAVANLEEGRY